jgi:hypothetical protein
VNSDGDVFCYGDGMQCAETPGKLQPDNCPLKGATCKECSWGVSGISPHWVYCDLDNTNHLRTCGPTKHNCPLHDLNLAQEQKTEPDSDLQPDLQQHSHQYWRTKEGLVMKIADLKDSHLLNCISMVERQDPIFELWLEAPPPQPELDMLASSLSDWEDDDSAETAKKLKKTKTTTSTMLSFRQYLELIKEAKKRGLVPV